MQRSDNPLAGEEYHPLYSTGVSPYLLVSAKYVGGEWSVAGGGRGIVETMAALEGFSGFDKGEDRRRSVEPCATFRFFEAELSRSAGFQHSLSSKGFARKRIYTKLQG